MLPKASQRVVAAAEQLGLSIDVLVFPEGTKTAAEAASAVGCELGQIVKSLVFMADETPLVALIPGDRRLDEQLLAHAAVVSHVRRAALEEVRTATGFAAGGTPPFGHDVPVWAARSLSRHDELYAAAGTPTTVFRIGYQELLRATGAAIAPLT